MTLHHWLMLYLAGVIIMAAPIYLLAVKQARELGKSFSYVVTLCAIMVPFGPVVMAVSMVMTTQRLMRR